MVGMMVPKDPELWDDDQKSEVIIPASFMGFVILHAQDNVGWSS